MDCTSPVRELQEELKAAGNWLLSPSSSACELPSVLDKVEHLLSRVEQAPSRSMQDALLPVMKALITQELLKHSDVDVKVSVAACVNEITRITAPDAPYDDERMKEIFKLTVMALEKLSLASGHCYTKAVSILDNIAQVRSCLLMLDLECDELIAEMFQLFLNTIRSEHSQFIFSNMEAIMTLVIEESEEISLDLLSPILNCVKKENQDISPLSYELGEHVLTKCAAKLKPYLSEGVRLMGYDLDEFAEVVSALCQDASGTENLVAKEFVPFGACPGRAVTDNDTTETRSNYTLEHEDSPKTLECCQRKSANARTLPDYLNSINMVNLEIKPELVPKKRGRKPKSLSGENAQELLHSRKNYEKKVSRSSRESSANESSKVELKNKSKSQNFSPRKSRVKNLTASPSQPCSFSDGSYHHKRVQPKKKGNLIHRASGLNSLLAPKEEALKKKSKISGDLQVKRERVTRKSAVASKSNLQTTPASGKIVIKKEGFNSDPEGKEGMSVPQTDTKKQKRANNISGKHALRESSNFSPKLKRGARKTAGSNVQTSCAPGKIVIKKENIHGNPEGKKDTPVPKRDAKRQSRNNNISGKHIHREARASSKIVQCCTSGSTDKDESQLEEVFGTKFKRKHTPWKEEVSEIPHNIRSFGEELIGLEIEVWWPLDRKFYEGAVYSFNPIEKKHRILYADGDEETLNLSMERWRLVGNNDLLVQTYQQGQETDFQFLDALSDVPQRKKAKIKTDSSEMLEIVASSSKRVSSSAGDSVSKSRAEGLKRSNKGTLVSTVDTLQDVDLEKGNITGACEELKDEVQKPNGKLETTRRRSRKLKGSKLDTSRNSKGESEQVASETHTVSTAKQEDMLSEEALRGDTRHGKLSNSIDAPEGEMESGKRRRRSIRG